MLATFFCEKNAELNAYHSSVCFELALIYKSLISFYQIVCTDINIHILTEFVYILVHEIISVDLKV